MSDKPIRIQRKRTKGWRMPPNTKSVTRPGKWGNPFKIGTLSLDEVRQLYRIHVHNEISQGRLNLDELRGFNLACFCSLDAEWCHANDLLELANR